MEARKKWGGEKGGLNGGACVCVCLSAGRARASGAEARATVRTLSFPGNRPIQPAAPHLLPEWGSRDGVCSLVVEVELCRDCAGHAHAVADLGGREEEKGASEVWCLCKREERRRGIAVALD